MLSAQAADEKNAALAAAEAKKLSEGAAVPSSGGGRTAAKVASPSPRKKAGQQEHKGSGSEAGKPSRAVPRGLEGAKGASAKEGGVPYRDSPVDLGSQTPTSGSLGSVQRYFGKRDSSKKGRAGSGTASDGSSGPKQQQQQQQQSDHGSSGAASASSPALHGRASPAGASPAKGSGRRGSSKVGHGASPGSGERKDV